ncbi:MAG: hypothetical protein ACYC26_00525 [Phycisphaerales bacterium]
MSAPLPSEKQINVFGSLDEQSAVEHFLGKNLQQAEELFRDNFICYQEDLMWMGPAAFCFYVDAAIAYLLSPNSTGDSSAVSSFCGVVEFQHRYYGQEISSARFRLKNAIMRILQDFERYDCDIQIYGDVAGRYKRMLESLA